MDLSTLGWAAPPIRRAGPDDAEAIARVHVQAWRETYATLLPEGRIARLSETDRTRLWRMTLAADMPNAPAVFVAEAWGGIVGFASLCPQRSAELAADGYDGEVSAIYLLRAAQRRGLGRALMCAAAHQLLDRGWRALSLWALTSNRPAHRFYRALGGQMIACRPGPDGHESAFVWRDPERLL